MCISTCVIHLKSPHMYYKCNTTGHVMYYISHLVVIYIYATFRLGIPCDQTSLAIKVTYFDLGTDRLQTNIKNRIEYIL